MSDSEETVVFDLDGTLADITNRMNLSLKSNGKIDWTKFFNPENIRLDLPNMKVIRMAKILKSKGFKIFIFSGRSDQTKEATEKWLEKYDVPFDLLKMIPMGDNIKDSILKENWLREVFDSPDDIFAVFDDRQQVVDMWRSYGIQVFQVAEGNF